MTSQASFPAIIDEKPLSEPFVDGARRALAYATAYRPPSEPLSVDRGISAARGTYLDWPKRETIAEAFGSWYDALRSAGLAVRAARGRPSRTPRINLARLNGRASANCRTAIVRRLRGLLQTA
jgi:hypothetical protein